jgi:hypothetical protein
MIISYSRPYSVDWKSSKCLRHFKHWDRAFKSRLRHGCLRLSVFVISCVDSGLAIGSSLGQGVLHNFRIISEWEPATERHPSSRRRKEKEKRLEMRTDIS